MFDAEGSTLLCSWQHSYPFDLIETFSLKAIQNHNERKVERNSNKQREKEKEKERNEGREEDGKKGDPWGAYKNKRVCV